MQKSFWYLYIHRSGQISPLLDRPPTPTPEKNSLDLHQFQEHPLEKWGGHVHTSPPRGDAFESNARPVEVESYTTTLQALRSALCKWTTTT